MSNLNRKQLQIIAKSLKIPITNTYYSKSKNRNNSCYKKNSQLIKEIREHNIKKDNQKLNEMKKLLIKNKKTLIENYDYFKMLFEELNFNEDDINNIFKYIDFEDFYMFLLFVDKGAKFIINDKKYIGLFRTIKYFIPKRDIKVINLFNNLRFEDEKDLYEMSEDDFKYTYSPTVYRDKLILEDYTDTKIYNKEDVFYLY